MAWTFNAFRPPFAAMDCSKTCGGILAPFRKPGIVTVLENSAAALSYAACVAAPGISNVNSTADSGNRFMVDAYNVVVVDVAAGEGAEEATEHDALDDTNAVAFVGGCGGGRCWCRDDNA
jgi:hypothetical protein